MRYFCQLLLLGGALFSSSALSESTLPHLVLIGVISDGSPGNQGVAVVRDQARNRTLMLKRGEALPDGSGFVVQAIERKFVLVANGAEVVRLEHNQASVAEEPAEKTTDPASDGAAERLSRLLEPLSRRRLTESSSDAEPEPLTFEKLKAELIEFPAPEILSDEEVPTEIHGEDYGH